MQPTPYTADEVRSALLPLGEARLRDFNATLLPTIPRERILGIRTPVLRSIAARCYTTWGTEAPFLDDLPHTYIEESHLHAFWIAKEREFDRALTLTERFLPFIDNWATCDSFRPVAFARQVPLLLQYVPHFLSSAHPYTVRFGIVMLMTHSMNDFFSPEQTSAVAAVTDDDYYVRMAVAWYFATAVAGHPDIILPYFEQRILPPWTHRKAIQKAVESDRVSPGIKAYLRTLRG